MHRRVRRLWTCILSSALFAAGPAAVLPGENDAISAPSEYHLQLVEAARALIDAVGEDVWPGWDSAGLELLLIDGEHEFLMGRERIPPGFEREGESLTAGAVARDRVFPPGMLATMALFGVWVLGVTLWHILHGTLPGAMTMGGIGMTALIANALSFWLLWRHRDGDANMRSAWICTRNDVLGNLAVLLAALGVFSTGTGWPDIAVAIIIAALALQGATIIIRQAIAELRAKDNFAEISAS